MSPVQAAELEILRGEEEETEIFLEGSEEGYSVFGEVTETENYLTLKTPEEDNSVNYQTLVLNEEGSKGRLLLSQRGGGGTGLWLRVKVEGIVPEITVTDDRSGIEEITYLLDGEAWSPAEITGKGKHVLTVTAKDLAGNTHTETMEFGIYDCIEVAASAGDVNYTETASFSALALYRGEPLPKAEVEFFLNGESLGVRWTNRDGMAWVHLPMELSPMAAELTVSIPQDDKRFLLAAEDTTSFTVQQEEAWINYTGEIFVRKGEPLRVSLKLEELWDFRDMRKGDITKAEVCAELYRIEEDCSKTLVDTEVLNPDKRGFVSQEFAAETGWYELKLYFTENSWYTGKEKLVYLVVYEGRVKPDWNGEAWWSPEWKEEDREKPDNNKQENNKQENEKQNDNGKDKNNGKKK